MNNNNEILHKNFKSTPSRGNNCNSMLIHLFMQRSKSRELVMHIKGKFSIKHEKRSLTCRSRRTVQESQRQPLTGDRGEENKQLEAYL